MDLLEESVTGRERDTYDHVRTAEWAARALCAAEEAALLEPVKRCPSDARSRGPELPYQ
ncbi:hypothetical protein GCM10010298_48130 [Streptomyces microflavus]|nr:hypothetical protein GCM10010298_48130 [Streptomyces microflavus]